MIIVGIMSMQRINNYGSFLQAFALKSMLEEIGAKVQFVDYHIGKPLIGNALIESKLKRNIRKVHETLKYNASLMQKIQFIIYKKEFSKKYHPILSINKNENYNPVLDVLVIGSDEVFNCIQSNSNVGYSLELFGKNHRAQRLVSYAASFGNTTIEKLQQYGKDTEIAQLLTQFDELSVRDFNSVNIVKVLTGRTADVHFDPVLMYDFKSKVNHIQVKEYKKRYIIVYAYSGRITQQENFWIKEYARKKNLKIWAIGGIHQCADRFIHCSPFELFSYFQDADEIITDTFHGCIFSILSQKPFAVLVRKSEGEYYGNEEKIKDLLFRLELNDRIVLDIQDVEKINGTKIDYIPIERKIEEQRKMAYDYLGRIIGECTQN